ncbi:MAG: UDP-N-acetylglucosamine 1-carboxyvinyltransferase [Gemmatimonadota bacterium]|nr:UDP-N-acetylglucosamine 1-carboxyvinyltransferase [Gemmatimonadota bacterium]
MDAMVVQGNGPLRGRVSVSGSKNAALPVLAASLLFDKPSVVDRVPDLRDIDTLRSVLTTLGAHSSHENGTVTMDASHLTSCEAPYELVRTMRASVYVLGPLLARMGRARVSLPGGCAWGPRPVDLHVQAMQKLGAKVEIEHGYIVAEAPSGGLRGAEIHFPISSVGATCNALLAAVLANGQTVLGNAAAEPEVVALADYLVACGAKISGAGTKTITVDGVSQMTPTRWAVIPDRIEAGTFLAAAAITGGDITLDECRADHMDAVLEKLREMGAAVEVDATTVRCHAPDALGGVHVLTAVYPGFPTDMQAQMIALACMGCETSVISDTIYTDRFTHVPELRRLGADIRLDGNTAVVHPADMLQGAHVMATDLRASAALIIAGLVAKGKTTIHRVYHLDRGYERIEEKLRAVGADIHRISE